MDNSCANFTNQSKRAHGHKKPLDDLYRTCLWEVLPAWRGGDGGKGTSGVSWGWGYTWVVALKGVSGKCALPASVVFSLVRNVPFQIDTFPFQTSFQFSNFRTAEQPCTKLHDANLSKLTIKHLTGTVCKDVYIYMYICKKKKKKKKKVCLIFINIIIYYYFM